MPGASVVARNVDTGVETAAQSSAAGLYSFPSLPAGSYTVTAEAAGFNRLVRQNVEVRTAQRVPLDLELTVGDVATSVEVTAAPPVLQTASTEVGVNFQPKMMNNLPLFTGGIRNPESFVSYMPGVNNGSGDSSINGSSRRSKEVLLDGASFTIPESGGVVFQFPAAEMFGEFKLVTNSFSAEYGRTGGGIEIFTTRSGTNQFHGGAYWNIRRDVLDANSWANNRAGTPRPKARLNEQGLGLGGPVWLPKVYDGRNKTFWYFTYTRRAQPASANSVINTVATPLMKQGDFSQIPLPLYDPATTSGSGSSATRQPFPNNRIPQARFSEISGQILPLIPDPTNAGIINNYAFVNQSNFQQHVYSIKLDQQITANNRVAFFVSDETQDTTELLNLPGPISHGLASQSQKPQNWRGTHDWVIKPTLLLSSTLGFSRTRQAWANDDQTGWSSRLGLEGVGRGEADAFPVVLFDAADGFTNLAQTNGRKTVGSQHNWTWHFNQGLTWVSGKHQWKFGWDYRRLATLSNPLDLALQQGEFVFSRDQTGDPQVLGSTGNSFASFLLGTPDSAVASVTALDVNDRAQYRYHAFYVQDDWRVSNRLTLNLGMRYDVPLARKNKIDQFTSFDPTLPNPGAGGLLGALAYAGEGEGGIGSKRFADTDWTEFGPRAGVAFRATEKDVFRAAYGIYYAAANHTTGGFCLGCAFGFGANPELQSPDGFSPALDWDGGFVPPPTFIPPPFIRPDFANGQSPWFLDPNSGRQSRHHNWNVTYQRQLPWNSSVSAAYVGQRGTQMNATVQLNQVRPEWLSLGPLLREDISSPAVVAAGFTPPYEGFAGTLAQALRPYPQFLEVPNHYSALGRNWYDAAQLKFEKRFGDLQFLSSYVYSKTLSRGARTQTAFNEEPQNSYDLETEKSLQVYDWPHVFNLLWTYEMPFGRGKSLLNTENKLLNLFVRGWTISGIHQYRSNSLIALSAPNTLGNGVLFTNYKRANLTGETIRTDVSRGDLDPDDPNARWINPDAFALPGQYEFGSASRYFSDLRNPPVFTENFSILKRTTLARAYETPIEFEYRADFFNLLNRQNMGNINGALTSPSFGRPTGPQTGARIITMGFRVMW